MGGIQIFENQLGYTPHSRVHNPRTRDPPHKWELLESISQGREPLLAPLFTPHRPHCTPHVFDASEDVLPCMDAMHE